MNIKLTVFFDNQFWVGIFERQEDNALQTSKLIFGSEPKDFEVYDFLLHNFYKLKFGEKVKAFDIQEIKINPKRLQRKIKSEIKEKGIGTKAQQAMKLSQEAKKLECKKTNKHEKELMEEQKFLQKQIKKKEKKKGH